MDHDPPLALLRLLHPFPVLTDAFQHQLPCRSAFVGRRLFCRNSAPCPAALLARWPPASFGMGLEAADAARVLHDTGDLSGIVPLRS